MGKGYALLFEQGCGKTLAAVAIAGRLYLDRKAKKMLVIAPLSVCPVWDKELHQYGAFPMTVRVIPDMKPKQKDRCMADMQSGILYDGLDTVVVNYDAMRGSKTYESILKWQPDIVICDESQRIKNPTAKQSKCAHAIGDAAKYKLILSGTPVCNTPLDYWSQYRFLDKSIFGNSYYTFKARYALMGGYEDHEVLAIRHLGELSEKAHRIASRVRKEDALDLPPYITETVYCDLEPEARAAYDLMARTGALELDSGDKITAPLVMTRLMRLAQLTGGYYVGLRDEYSAMPQNLSAAKARLCREIVEDLLGGNKDKKVVIFCRFVPEIGLLENLLRVSLKDIDKTILAQEYGVQTMYGATPGNERGMIVERFQNDPHAHILIAQTHTAGLGITLTAADTCIFYSPDFSYADYAQARDRIHRAGQNKPCTCIHLCVRDTIDEHAFAALEQKRSIADAAVDNWRQFLH